MKGTAALLLVAALAGCRPEPVAERAIADTEFAEGLEVDLAASTHSASGLYHRDLVVGTGEEVRPGRVVSVHYVGAFPDGRNFDANRPGQTPFRFRVGQGEVIPGWDEGVVGMRAGGKRQLIVPSSLGYGPNGYGPIPGGAVLVFLVEVAAVE